MHKEQVTRKCHELSIYSSIYLKYSSQILQLILCISLFLEGLHRCVLKFNNIHYPSNVFASHIEICQQIYSNRLSNKYSLIFLLKVLMPSCVIRYSSEIIRYYHNSFSYLFFCLFPRPTSKPLPVTNF